MDSSIAAALIGGLFGLGGALGGAWFGFAMSNRATRRRDDYARLLVAHRVRTMLRLEVEDNLHLVRDALHILEIGLDGNELERQFQARLRLTSASVARWDRTMWERLAPDLPSALDETIIRHVYDLYADLATVTRLRAAITARLPDGLTDTYRQYRESQPDQLGPGSSDGLAVNWQLRSKMSAYNSATLNDYTTCLNILNKWQGQHDLIADTPPPTPPAGAWTRLRQRLRRWRLPSRQGSGHQKS